MKKILAVALTVLMLLPMLASIAFAAIEIPEGTEVYNIAGEASIEVVDTKNQNISIGSDVDAGALIDGDKSTGTSSPQGQYYSYVLTFDETRYFTDIVVACNGQGTLASGETVDSDKYNLYEIEVIVYDGENVSYTSGSLDVTELKEVTVSANAKGDRVEIYKLDGVYGRNEYMWEIETYSPDMEICSAQVENIASQAIFSATGANANYWWAMDYKAWVDGDPLTGSHSPKGRNYSVWMHFSEEHLFSQIDLVCNTDGGATLSAGDKINDRAYNNGMMRVLVYNYNEDLVWDSDLVDTSTVTTLSVAPYVEGAIIEIRFFNGNYGGGEYMYEVSAYAQSGEHVFETTDEENPGCLTPGYREYTCHCGKVIKQSVDATGFHKWNDGEITKVPTNTDNGVFTVTCDGCGSTKLYDIPSTGHNWDSGTKYVPTLCDEVGYTLYKCTDEGCEMSYKDDYVEASEHEWDDGVTTKLPTVTEEGVITYTCSKCGGEKYGRIRKHKYTDNTVAFTDANIADYKVEVNKTPAAGYGTYNEATYVDVDPATMFDGDKLTYWYGPAGTYVDVILDKEYVFTSGLFYASANWSAIRIEFYLNDEIVIVDEDATEHGYNTGNINTGVDPNNPQECDMYDYLKEGVRADKIRIITLSSKWENGSACKLQELNLVVHKCEFSEIDYITDASDYKAPSCSVDGSCRAKCQVCGNIETIVIEATPDNSHTYGEIDADVEPTCLNSGVGHAKCTSCNETVYGITIPATGEHEFTTEVTYVSAKCGFSGVGHMICKYCEKVGSIYEIAPTGHHEYEWAKKSQASYTAVGKTEYCCIYCDQLDPDTAENVKIAEMLTVPEDLITFVGAASSTEDGKNTLSFTYKIDLAELPEIENTCDVRVITTIKDAQGREASIESYGKFATNTYNAETGEFTVTIYPSSADDMFEVTTAVRLMNMRGVIYKTYATGNYSMNTAN